MSVGGIDLNLLLTLRALLEEENVMHAGARLGLSQPSMSIALGRLRRHLPFVVAGTDMVAIVPERLARRVEREAGVLVVEPPFGTVELIEAVWWHPSRTHDPALYWLRGVLRDIGAALAPATQPRANPHR